MDARYYRLKQGLEQLDDVQLNRVLEYRGEMVVDEFYYFQGGY